MAATPDLVTAIAKEAFIYGYPVVDSHNIITKYVLNKDSGEYKAAFNHVGHNRDLASPKDTAIVAMNVDTPYSFAWLDLRTEPQVVTIPVFEEQRYVSAELIDLYSYIVGYISPRTNGNAGGDFLVAGPGWDGPIPPGIRRLFRCPTEFMLILYRTQLFDAGDLPNVNAIQDGYRITGLSDYTGRALPPPPPPFVDVQPIDVRREKESMQFFTILNAMLSYMPALEDEIELRERFALIGIRPGVAFDPSDDIFRAAVVEGMRQGLQAMYARAGTVKSSAELFGSREFLGQDYLIRAVGALLGIYGNAAEEYLGVGYQTDSEGRPFDGNYCYQITFRPDDIPPVGAFWSITAYNGHKFLVENPINRYVINSPMVPSLNKDAGGGFTLYLQADMPGVEAEPNWLPVSRDAFNLAFRTYQPGQAIRDGSWQAPPVVRVD